MADTTRAGRPVNVRYVLVDLTHPQIGDAKRDLLTLKRKLGRHLSLKGNRKHDGTRAVLKVVYPAEDHERAVDWFQNRSWKAAVVQITNWANRGQVRHFVGRPAWIGEEPSELRRPR